MQTFLLFAVFAALILFANVASHISQNVKGDKGTLVLSTSLSLGFMLCSFTVVNYEYVSSLIKSGLSPQQIEWVRNFVAGLTDGGGVLSLLQLCTSQLLVSVIAVSAVIIGDCAYRHLFICHSKNTQFTEKEKKHAPIRISSNYIYFYPLTAIKLNS